VLERRPDTPLRLAALVESCMAKLPADRPPSMDAVVAELEACFAELEAKDGDESTMIIRKPVAKPARGPRSRRVPVWPLPVLGVLLLAAVAGAILLRGGGDNPGAATGGTMQLLGVASYDPPPGDGEEHDERVGDATDGNPSTYWTTESYRSFSKPGVGLVVEASGSPDQIAVTTDTPGFTAEIKAGNAPQGPFETVGESKSVGDGTTWELDGPEAQYYVVWITDLDGRAHVNEVKAS
jgi:hypothetical protein